MEITHLINVNPSKDLECQAVKIKSKHFKAIISIIEKDPERLVDGAAENISDGRVERKPDQQTVKTVSVVTDQQKRAEEVSRRNP